MFVSVLSAGQVDPSVLDPQFPRITREWVDSTGEFRVTAKLVGVTKTGVLLEKENEKTITVPLTRLDKTSREIASEAYPHFVVQQKIHDIIAETIDPLVKIGTQTTLLRSLIDKANVDLRKLTIRTCYRIVKVTKPKQNELKVRFERLHDWRVTPDTWKTVGARPSLGYLSGWNLKAADIGAAEVVAEKSIFEMSGVPQLIFPVARDFSFRGVGHSKDAVRGQSIPVAVQIGFAVMQHKIRVFTPEK